MKSARDHPDYATYRRQWTELYEHNNYGAGLAGYFLRKSHEWAETGFGPDRHFAHVLEVGAGPGLHLRYVRHSFDEYLLTDIAPPRKSAVRLPPSCADDGKLTVAAVDAIRLPFSDDSFDRLIATHVLEHLYRPHEVLQEWVRVLRPGGILSLVLPCDPGLLWRAGRTLASRGKFIREGIDYDYWMAREHVNPLNNLVAFVRYYFSDYRETWLPLRVPSIDLNLFYIAHIRV